MNKHIEQEEPSLIPESARTDSRVLILGYQNYKLIGKKQFVNIKFHRIGQPLCEA